MGTRPSCSAAAQMYEKDVLQLQAAMRIRMGMCA
jgi:hypothetical protein